jgi:hypothetical protein
MVNELSSYRRLNLTRSRSQLQSNSESFLRNREFSTDDLLGIEDYSFRTPVQYMVSTADYLEMRRKIIELTPVPTFSPDIVDSETQLLGKDESKLSFDRKLTQIVLEIFPMNPNEAASREVWSYITLRVLPDYAMWRYPNRSNDPEWERYLGSERNTFKRLWWRAYMLGGTLAAELDEDELVQMFERTESIGSNKRLMQAMAEFALESREAMKSIGGKSSSLITETAKSLRRTMAVISYESMTDSEIVVFVNTHATEALDRIRASRKP